MVNKIILAIGIAFILISGFLFITKKDTAGVGTALNCATNTTCLPSMELTGNADTSTPSLQVDKQGITVTSGGINVTAGGVTIASGGLTLTTSDSATSTASLGCIQTTATSTATAIRLVFGNNISASTTYRGSNSVGIVYWQYGTCP